MMSAATVVHVYAAKEKTAQIIQTFASDGTGTPLDAPGCWIPG